MTPRPPPSWWHMRRQRGGPNHRGGRGSGTTRLAWGSSSSRDPGGFAAAPDSRQARSRPMRRTLPAGAPSPGITFNAYASHQPHWQTKLPRAHQSEMWVKGWCVPQQPCRPLHRAWGRACRSAGPRPSATLLRPPHPLSLASLRLFDGVKRHRGLLGDEGLDPGSDLFYEVGDDLRMAAQ